MINEHEWSFMIDRFNNILINLSLMADDWREKVKGKPYYNKIAGPVLGCVKCNSPHNLKSCPCYLRSYCSTECQREDWPNHKESHLQMMKQLNEAKNNS